MSSEKYYPKKLIEGVTTAVFPKDEIRFVNWYLQHGCDLDCSYCRVPLQAVKPMNLEQRLEALCRLRTLCSSTPVLSILGGEPTLRPDYLVGAVEDAASLGFRVNTITNGRGLTPELIQRLAQAGLSHLGMSVDSDQEATKSNLDRALHLLTFARENGIVPAVNTVITRNTDPESFKHFARTIIGTKIMISPLMCSPQVPNGAFSNANPELTPTKDQIRQIIPWLAWQKIITGRVLGTFGYLWTLYRLTETEDQIDLWHCSPHLRIEKQKNGRGSLTLDSDGYLGPCQEYPRVINLLDTEDEQLTLQLVDAELAETTKQCPGCLYNCYIMEEELQGSSALLETPNFIETLRIHSNNKHK
ncbi:radical SAM protein [Pseudomonadota bacterium]